MPGGRPARSVGPVKTTRGLVSALIAALLTVASLGIVAPAAADTTPGWAEWDPLVGSSGAYTSAMRLPANAFPAATVTSDSRAGSVGVITGTSTWLSEGTPIGAAYGSSEGLPYLNLRPRADTATTPSTTTYAFDTPTPSGGWTFVLGDIDADAVQISARTPDGTLLTAAELGYRSSFNYCAPGVVGKPSCTGAATDVPTWDPTTLTLTGNAAALDTSGASAWFEPSVAVSSLTFSFTRRAGLPIFQTWFASLARDISGTVRDVTGGGADPLPGVTVGLYDANGTLVETRTTAADGTYLFDAYAAQAGYRVGVVAPDGQVVVGPSRQAADLSTTDATDVDFAVRDIVPAAISGVVTADGTPLAGVVVTISSLGEPDRTVETDADGAYVFDTNPPDTYTLIVTPPEGYATTVAPGPVTVAPGSSAPITDQDFVLAAPPALSGAVTANGTPVPGAVVTASGPGGLQLATTTRGDGTYTFPLVPAGDWVVRVEPPAGYLADGPTARDESVGTTDVEDVDFTLARPGSVAGTVVDTAGAPVSGASVLLDGPGGPVTLTTTTDGTYALGGLSAGTYRATITPPTGLLVVGPAELTVVVTSLGEIFLEQDFLLEPAAVPPDVPPVAPPVTPPTTPVVVPPPSVSGGATVGSQRYAPRPSAAQPTNRSTSRLARTGADTDDVLALSVTLVLAGGALLLVRHRPRAD